MADKMNNPQISTLCQIRDVYREIYEFELTFQQLYNLGLNEGMLLCSLNTQKYSSNELAGILGLSNSNTSKVIKSIEKKGLIKRIVGKDDKRQMYFALTQAGQKKLESIKCAEFEIPETLRTIIKPM
ncbi:DNA-binding MarR family transcriptional regulator [Dysgonomonas sp. PFB1-18]|uniref:MarR family winged helix-turn-helix transcriptional regulator n=1 Tax=unclassified Dysgonomonas TaxID=2630389 RepID=UPI002476EA3E|nr:MULTISPECIES: winged helix DNA-binding protein [unclassified Dysgonomonas]MDH6309496.1 DNA-binding MarR family transcriptional regulator [Dysgonomonas sp. PF1-14]MDH6339176.1 DNA-binding MarR family transcriptional regulator [Dysgonomonas sp. PF1-16]MDH6380537.1 DNA-binding MarR family transcriptional regulator [Dysgonomonas sp. PFB1-18]MDH6398033.1 DNA-binding MarR family transcriptional regulator [Dysgonomonas sp. PF1-23]